LVWESFASNITYDGKKFTLNPDPAMIACGAQILISDKQIVEQSIP